MNIQNKMMLQIIQDDYLALLLKYEASFAVNPDPLMIMSFLDEVKIFWLKRVDIVNHELKHITDKYSTFLLSGVIYLNISNYEHYYFKTLGQYHVLNEPILKLDIFFRNKKVINTEETIQYFLKVYKDIVNVLRVYPYYFYVLPIAQLAWEDKDEHRLLLDEFYWKFISSIFKNEFLDIEEFCAKYNTFDDIEKDLDEFILENLIFTDVDDSTLNLKQRAEKYCKNQKLTIMQEMSEAQLFIFMTHSHVSQALDIIITANSMNMNPYVRVDVPFRYILLIMGSFMDDIELKSLIEKTVIFYILYKTVDQESFQKIGFVDYCERLKQFDLLSLISKQIEKSEIDVFVSGIKKVDEIISEQFARVLV